MLNRAKFFVLGFAFLLSPFSEAIYAQQSEGIVRTFMVVGLVNESVDFSDGDSVLLKVNKDSTSFTTKTFVTDPSHPLSAFSGESFGFGVSAMYVTRSLGDTPAGFFAWLLDEDTPEAPPTGSVALLGPDAVILQTETFHLNSSGGIIYPTNDEAQPIAMIVTAVFTK
jgi:hypothetical protein